MNLDINAYIDGILTGNRRMLAKTVTLIESRLPAHSKAAAAIMENILPHTGKSIRLGITGVPGVGKSTFIENTGVLLADKGHKVAVLAIDPSSRRSGGSILGDKTRMEKLSAHANTFIRPSPAGETLGGVAAKTREVLLLCEAAGFDIIFVETVGVGQSETSVAAMVDFFLVLMLAGAGDELQGIKKGVLELADGIAINKSDGNNVQAVEKAKQELEIALHFMRPESPNWSTPVLSCSSVTDGGTGHIWDMVLDHNKKFKTSGEFLQRRKKQSLEWMWTLVQEGLQTRFHTNENIRQDIPILSKDVQDDRITPAAAAQRLLAYL
jgi:LAO/AO transport system kinase